MPSLADCLAPNLVVPLLVTPTGSDGFLGAFVPYFIGGMFCPVLWSCLICQESRAVKAAWKMNNMMPLAPSQMPVMPQQTVHASGGSE